MNLYPNYVHIFSLWALGRFYRLFSSKEQFLPKD
jgi:hypothetical protein